MKKTTINYATAWLMGIDLIATGKQLKAKRRSHSLTQEELSEVLSRAGTRHPERSSACGKTARNCPVFPMWCFWRNCTAALWTSWSSVVGALGRRMTGTSPSLFIFHTVCQGRTHGYAFVLLYVTLGLYYVTSGLSSNASTDGIIKSQNPKRNI